MVWWWMSMAAIGEDCSTRDLDEAISAAERELQALEEDGFKAAVKDAVGRVDCLTEPIRPDKAAAVHGLGVVRALVERDMDAIPLGVRAMQRADPNADWSPLLIPEDHTLRTMRDKALTGTGPREEDTPAPKPRYGWLTFDGHEEEMQPSPPFVLQWHRRDKVWLSRLVLPGQDLPLQEYKPVAPVVALGVGGAVGAGVGVTQLIPLANRARDLRERYENGTDSALNAALREEYNDTVARLEPFAALTGIGVAAIVTGVVWYVLKPKYRRSNQVGDGNGREHVGSADGVEHAAHWVP